MDNSDYNLTSLPPMMNVDGNGQLLMPLPNGQPHQVPPSEQQQEQQPDVHHELQPLNPVSSAAVGANLASSIVQQFAGHTAANPQLTGIAPDYGGGGGGSNVNTHLPLAGFFGEVSYHYILFSVMGLAVGLMFQNCDFVGTIKASLWPPEDINNKIFCKGVPLFLPLL